MDKMEPLFGSPEAHAQAIKRLREYQKIENLSCTRPDTPEQNP